MPHAEPCGGAAALARRNRELYDDTSSPVWRLAVYDALHEGWEFINLGGRRLLDAFAGRARLGPRTSVLELCAGQAATCRYLAARYGCSVTGVEWNRHQLEQARLALAQDPPEASGRVRLVCADAATWRPRRQYDAALCLDSLMLFAEPREAVATAAAALRGGGLLTAAVITAGPALDAQVSRYVSENDGMLSLVPAEAYSGMLRTAGFEELEEEDGTEMAAAASATMLQAFDRGRERMVAACGEEEYRTSREAAVLYLEAFRRRQLVYSVLSGRRS